MNLIIIAVYILGALCIISSIYSIYIIIKLNKENKVLKFVIQQQNKELFGHMVNNIVCGNTVIDLPVFEEENK